MLHDMQSIDYNDYIYCKYVAFFNTGHIPLKHAYRLSDANADYCHPRNERRKKGLVRRPLAFLITYTENTVQYRNI